MYHLKLVGRQIFQRKGYFVINTIGLAVALTASVLIYTFLVKEWQTNTFHENVDHIYRITVQTDRNTHWGSEVCSSLGEIAKAELPEVTDYTRIITAREMKIRWENDDHYQTGISCGYLRQRRCIRLLWCLRRAAAERSGHKQNGQNK